MYTNTSHSTRGLGKWLLPSVFLAKMTDMSIFSDLMVFFYVPIDLEDRESHFLLLFNSEHRIKKTTTF